MHFSAGDGAASTHQARGSRATAGHAPKGSMNLMDRDDPSLGCLIVFNEVACA
jgi:hypothetical protein